MNRNTTKEIIKAISQFENKITMYHYEDVLMDSINKHRMKYNKKIDVSKIIAALSLMVSIIGLIGIKFMLSFNWSNILYITIAILPSLISLGVCMKLHKDIKDFQIEIIGEEYYQTKVFYLFILKYLRNLTRIKIINNDLDYDFSKNEKRIIDYYNDGKFTPVKFFKFKLENWIYKFLKNTYKIDDVYMSKYLCEVILAKQISNHNIKNTNVNGEFEIIIDSTNVFMLAESNYFDSKKIKI